MVIHCVCLNFVRSKRTFVAGSTNVHRWHKDDLRLPAPEGRFTGGLPTLGAEIGKLPLLVLRVGSVLNLGERGRLPVGHVGAILQA